MKDFMTFWGPKYSVVSTSDTIPENCVKSAKSLNAKRSFCRGFSLVDTFFHKRTAEKQTRCPKRVFLLMAAGIISICIGVTSILINPYNLIFKWKLTFSDGGEIYNLWAKPPVNLYIKIYLFNITNSEQFLEGKEKLNVEQVGPYVYRELLSHENIVFNDNGTLSTTTEHPLVWQEHLSEGHKEDDVLMLTNIALLSIAQVAADRSYFFRLPINLLIRQTDSQPLIKMTAKEFMFGYESDLVNIGHKFLPNWISFEKVGLIDRMYDVKGDYETVYTGDGDPSLSGLLDTFKGSQHLPQWNGVHCSNITGASDGAKFKSFIQPNDTMKFFRKSLCRTGNMVPVASSNTVISGLSATKYVFEKNSLDNGFFDERNKCYCREGNCLQRGLQDVTDCYYGFPIALSYPHFMDADEKLLQDVTGCKPNSSLHESFFMIQSMSGLPLKVSVRFQINMAMRDVSNMAHVDKFSNITIPMLWFEITMNELPINLQNRFNLYLNVLPILDKILLFFFFLIGVICLAMANIRAALRLSNSVSEKKLSKNNKHNNSKSKKSAIYLPCEEQFIETKLKEDNKMCQIGIKNETNYILDKEPALVLESDDDDDTLVEMKCDSSEQMSLTTDLELEYGETSSSIEDIGTDNFSLLHIVEISE